MSDESNTGTPEDEKQTSALLALLYPDPGMEAEESELVSDSELGEMQSLRALFRDMPEEEPSAAVSNKLLALAAQHAPKPQQESKGLFAWLSDLLMPLVAHPGLAAAATLVLVVGVAGTLYVKGGAKLAEPEVASRAEAPAGSSSLAPTTTSVDQNEVSEAAPKTPAEDPAAFAEEAEDTGLAADESNLDYRSGDAIDVAGKLGREGGGGKAAKPKRKQQPSTRGAKGGFELGTSSPGYGSGGASDSTGRRVTGIADAPAASEPAPANKPRPEPITTTKSLPESKKSDSKPAPRPKTNTKKKSASPPPPPRSPTRSGAQQAPTDAEEDLDDSAGADDKSVEKQEQEAPEPSAVSLHNQAVRAAKNGNCARVIELGNKIRKIDSGYYDRTYLADTRLKACRASL